MMFLRRRRQNLLRNARPDDKMPPGSGVSSFMAPNMTPGDAYHTEWSRQTPELYGSEHEISPDTRYHGSAVSTYLDPYPHYTVAGELPDSSASATGSVQELLSAGSELPGRESHRGYGEEFEMPAEPSQQPQRMAGPKTH